MVAPAGVGQLAVISQCSHKMSTDIPVFQRVMQILNGVVTMQRTRRTRRGLVGVEIMQRSITGVDTKVRVIAFAMTMIVSMIVCAGGCAKSAATGWAQTSPVIHAEAPVTDVQLGTRGD